MKITVNDVVEIWIDGSRHEVAVERVTKRSLTGRSTEGQLVTFDISPKEGK